MRIHFQSRESQPRPPSKRLISEWREVDPTRIFLKDRSKEGIIEGWSCHLTWSKWLVFTTSCCDTTWLMMHFNANPQIITYNILEQTCSTEPPTHGTPWVGFSFWLEKTALEVVMDRPFLFIDSFHLYLPFRLFRKKNFEFRKVLGVLEVPISFERSNIQVSTHVPKKPTLPKTSLQEKKGVETGNWKKRHVSIRNLWSPPKNWNFHVVKPTSCCLRCTFPRNLTLQIISKSFQVWVHAFSSLRENPSTRVRSGWWRWPKKGNWWDSTACIDCWTPSLTWKSKDSNRILLGDGSISINTLKFLDVGARRE